MRLGEGYVSDQSYGLDDDEYPGCPPLWQNLRDRSCGVKSFSRGDAVFVVFIARLGT